MVVVKQLALRGDDRRFALAAGAAAAQVRRVDAGGFDGLQETLAFARL